MSCARAVNELCTSCALCMRPAFSSSVFEREFHTICSERSEARDAASSAASSRFRSSSASVA